jgi:integrase
MGHRTDYLWERGHQYWLRLSVPRPVQKKKLLLSPSGKPLAKIQMHLSDSHSAAQAAARQLAARYHAVFDQVMLGILKTPDDVAAAIREGTDNDRVLWPGFDDAYRRARAEQLRADQLRQQRERMSRILGWSEADGDAPTTAVNANASTAAPMMPAPAAPTGTGERISQALEAWIEDMQRNKPRRPDTIKGHRQRAGEFIAKFGDPYLTDVTRPMAYSFRNSLGRSNRTCNTYIITMGGIFRCAKVRGAFSGENPFENMMLEDVGEEREPLTVDEMQKLFDAAPRDVDPKEHSPASASPWVCLIAAFSGACLEEICQLTLDDVREEQANGETVLIFDLHNGDADHQLKNEDARPRYVPVHSVILRAGLGDYIANLRRDGHTRLFPGLKQRASKGNKWSPEVGSRFRKLRLKIGVTRPGVCFHSYRHGVNKLLEEVARVPEVDRARLLGHEHPNMTAKYGKGKARFRSAGPMLKVVRDVAEQISYEGLRV